MQLRCGGKRFNVFNAKIISNKNDEIRLIFRKVTAKNNFN